MKTVALLIIIITAICAYMFFQLFMFDAPKPFSASEDYNPAGAAMVASQQNSMNLTAAENNLNAARLQITAAYENSRQAESDALIAQSEAQNKILLATNEAAVATAEKQYVIELTTDYTINLTINANIAVSNLNGTTTSQAHVVNIQSTTVANNVTMDAQQIASRATLSAITVQETRTALQIQNEISAASRQAQLDEIEFQNQINAQRDQRLADIKSAETKQMMLFFGTGLLTVIVLFGGVYFIIDLRMKKQVHKVGGHVIYSNQLMLAPPTEPKRLPAPQRISQNPVQPSQVAPTSNKYQVQIGTDERTGRPLLISLKKAGHWIVAGTTGSGKTRFAMTCFHKMLNSHTKNELQIAICDGKSVSFLILEKYPHLMENVARTTRQIDKLIRRVETEMDRRTALIVEMANGRSIMCDNIFDYMDRTGDRLPLIILYIDEKAEAVTSGTPLDETITRIARLGRSAGIILILSSQDLYRQNFSGQLMSNIATRFVFYIPDKKARTTVAQIPNEFQARMRNEQGYGYASSPEISPTMFNAAYADNREIESGVRNQVDGNTSLQINVPQLQDDNLGWIDAVSETHGLNSAERAEQKAELELLEKIKANKDGTRSRRQLTELIYGKGKNDGSYSRRVKEVMEKYHVTTPPEWA